MFNRRINRWWTVVAGVLGNAVGAGVVVAYVLGVFTKAISADFGWDRSFTTAGVSCFFIVSGIGNLVLGSLMARWTIRSVTIAFVSLFSVSIMAVSLLPPSAILFCLTFSLMGFFGASASAMPYAVAISSQFDRNRGLALGIMVSGTGLGALVLPNYANFLLESHGWRVGYLGIGLLVGVVSLFGLIVCFRTPAGAKPRVVGRPWGAKRAFLSQSTFWLIGIAIFCISVALVGVITNMVPILTDRGLTTRSAASFVGLLGAASWASRISIGAMLDRVHAKFVAAGIFLLSALGLGLLIFRTDEMSLYSVTVLVGLGMGSEADLVTFMMSRYYPNEALSEALGAVWLFWAWASGLGVFAGSLCYDLTGDYRFALTLFLVLAILAAALIVRLGPYPIALAPAESRSDAQLLVAEANPLTNSRGTSVGRQESSNV